MGCEAIAGDYSIREESGSLVSLDSNDRLIEYAQELRARPEGVHTKLLRQGQVLSHGIGGAFADVVAKPLDKAPELVAAGGFGAGLRLLSRFGVRGKALAAAVGIGLQGKMIVDEVGGSRWSTFSSAMRSAWHSEENLDRAIDATKNSVGALAVDSIVALAGYKTTSGIMRKPSRAEDYTWLPLRPERVKPRPPEVRTISLPANPLFEIGAGIPARPPSVNRFRQF